MAISGYRSEKAPQITSAALRVNNKELALIPFPRRRVEGHICHQRRVLRRFCGFLKQNLEQFVFLLTCEKPCVFL